MELRLPNLGEGIESATVTEVLVKPGDVVQSGQPVLSVETDKATMPIEADAGGTVEQVLVKAGDKIAVGTAILKLGGAGRPEPPAPKQAKSDDAASRERQRPESAKPPAADAPGSPATPRQAQPASGAKTELALQSLGEGIEGGTVREVYVKPGDAVKAGQAVLALDTDKAAVDIAAETDGVVEAVHVKPGDKVAVGGKLATIQASGAPAQPASRETKMTPPAVSAPVPPAPAARAAEPARQASPNGNGTATVVATKGIIPAGPATRRLARELGVTLGEIPGSGRGGRITLDDVKGFVRTERERAKKGEAAVPGGGIVVNAFALPPLPDFSKFGPVEVKEVATIRQTIAKNLTAGWRTMPMVTQHDLADITELEAGRKRIVEAMPKGSPKITMTVLAVKACVAALKEFPHFNSSYDMNAGKLILKKYFGIGIAVDTERGLVVPVLKDADKKSIRDLAGEVAALAEKARANKLAIEEMRGGTFTITNLGGIGGTAFTPIVNYPEVAILGLSRSSMQPVVKDGEIVPRLMMPLSLTYDHRVIDGADGCRFTVRLAQLFSDPLRLLMET
jgi:pyruvate dehydrogenase E2 component (dihydrolipoamide acetyltransferase)